MSYHLGANIGSSPSGPPPPDRRRYLLTVAAGVLLVAGLATTAVASGLRDDSETATTDTTTPGDKDTTTTGSDTEETSSTSLDLGAPIGDLGLGADEPPNDPLTGSDWSDEARTQFLSGCADDGWESYGLPADQVCSCIYDRVSTSEDFTFEEFNDEVWTAEDASTDTPAGQGMYDAVNGCILELGGLG